MSRRRRVVAPAVAPGDLEAPEVELESELVDAEPEVAEEAPVAPSFVVAERHGVGTLGRGILPPGTIVHASDFPGGQERIEDLASAGVLVVAPGFTGAIITRGGKRTAGDVLGADELTADAAAALVDRGRLVRQ